MKKSINVMLAGLLMVPMLAFGLSVAAPTATFAAPEAAEPCDTTKLGIQNAANCTQDPDNPNPGSLFDGDDSVFKTVTNAALFIIGAISVLMLIYGGIRYTVSGGDTKQVTDAKNTILYAVVGLIVAILAYAIVNFVIGNLVK